MSKAATADTSTFDLQRYFDRIDYHGSKDVSVETLTGIHKAHVFRVPFENLNIFLGKLIEIDFPSIEEKLVRQNRGGYCFEMNSLFATALEQLGFDVKRLQARVWLKRPNMPEFSVDNPPLKSHELLLVTIEGKPYVADVGFGGAGLMEPIALETDTENPQYGETYRLIEDAHFGYMLQYLHSNYGWSDMYTFDLNTYHPNDYIHANYYTCRSPESFFTKTRITTIASDEGRVVLQDNQLKLNRQQEPVWQKELLSIAEYQENLQRYFGITLSDEQANQLLSPLLQTAPAV